MNGIQARKAHEASSGSVRTSRMDAVGSGIIRRRQEQLRGALEGEAVRGGAGGQLCRGDLLGTYMRLLWHFQGWSWELYREPGVWPGRRAGARAAEGLYCSALPFSQLFGTLSLGFATKESRVLDKLPPADHQSGHMASLFGQGPGVPALTVPFIPPPAGQLTTKVSLQEPP